MTATALEKQTATTPTNGSAALPKLEKEGFWEQHAQLICAVVAGVLLLVAKTLQWSGIATGHGIAVTMVVPSLVSVAFCLGFYFGARATVDSLREKKLDINLLMVAGAVLAIFVGSAAEGALLLFLFTLSGALEHYAMQ